MHFFDLLSLILENLNRRKARVALTAVGVVIGTAAVVVLVSLGIGLQENATKQLYGIGELTRIDVYPQYDMGPGPIAVRGGIGGGGGAVPTPVPITDKTIEAIAAIPGVAAVVPRDGIPAETQLVAGRLVAYANIVGVAVSDVADLGVEVQSGSTALPRGTLIVGSDVASSYFQDPKWRPGQDPPQPPDLLGKQIKLVVIKWTQDGQQVRKTLSMTVGGITARKTAESDWSVYMTLDEVTTLSSWAQNRRINRNKDGYPQLFVRAADVDEVLDIVESIKNLGYQANSSQEYIQPINNFYLILQVIFGGVGAIALLVAAIGIANTMAMAILERTREIGLMKAVGATNRDVLSVFLGEAAGIGFLGGVGGVALAWSAGQVINVLAMVYLSGQSSGGGGFVPPPPSGDTVIMPVWLMAGALAFATVIGLISGLYPALRAATLVPVNALKYE